MASAVRVGCHDYVPLEGGWSVARANPNPDATPANVDLPANAWLPATAPGTVASALPAVRPAADGSERLDASDWWFRTSFDGPTKTAGERYVLRLSGLATIVHVWLNGKNVAQSRNMFVEHAVDVTEQLESKNELWLRCQALDPLLAKRRPRPRWRAPMVEHQQLRWIRTSLLGRTPGWSPSIPAVGPWRPIRLETQRRLAIEDIAKHASTSGPDGVIAVALTLRPLGGARLTGARLVASHAGAHWESRLALTPDGAGRCQGELRIPSVALWWPHTHGDQPLYELRLLVDVDGGEVVVDLGRVGFRTVHVETTDGDFNLHVNGVPIFCRGACWTPPSAARLVGSAEDYERTLGLVRAAGMNMLRVCGPMVYESDTFYDACDAAGLLVWQDFMFANMDYPEDPEFLADVTTEVRQALGRWQARPCIAALCGDSEGEQQAAMWGTPRSSWERPLFRQKLRELCDEHLPGVPYWPSSASGGALPHQPNSGTASYYGVGAYLRPPEDARRSGLRFATECLAFANVPDEPVLSQIAPNAQPRVHSPAWKAGVPRDLGAGWDFDDVRDFYVRTLLGVADPVSFRYADHDRYLALGRVATGEAMDAAFREWRRRGSSTRGALVWFLRDLVAGAGWGVLDVSGHPKASYFFLKRILQSRVVFFTNEGLNGISVHAINESSEPWEGDLSVELFRNGETPVETAQRRINVPSRGILELEAAALLESFWDTTYAYRFGPAQHDLVVARLVDARGELVSEAFHFPLGLSSTVEADLGVEAKATATENGDFSLSLKSRRFAQAVAIDVPGFAPSDNYLNLAPQRERKVALVRTGTNTEPRGTIQPLNARSSTRIAVAPPTAPTGSQ